MIYSKILWYLWRYWLGKMHKYILFSAKYFSIVRDYIINTFNIYYFLHIANFNLESFSTELAIRLSLLARICAHLVFTSSPSFTRTIIYPYPLRSSHRMKYPMHLIFQRYPCIDTNTQLLHSCSVLISVYCYDTL